MSALTPETLAELRRLLDAATPGPWMACEDEDEVLIVLDDDSNHWPGRYTAIARGFEQGDDYGLSDALLVTAAVNALPALLDAAEDLRRLAIAATRAELRYPYDDPATHVEVIRCAMTHRDALAAKLAEVRALHIAHDCTSHAGRATICAHRPGICLACLKPLPCPTIRALDATPGEATA